MSGGGAGGGVDSAATESEIVEIEEGNGWVDSVSFQSDLVCLLDFVVIWIDTIGGVLHR